MYWFLNKYVIINLARTVLFFIYLFYILHMWLLMIYSNFFLYSSCFLASLCHACHLVSREFHNAIQSLCQYYHYILFSRAILLAEADTSTLLVEAVVSPNMSANQTAQHYIPEGNILACWLDYSIHYPQENSRYSFLLEAASTPGP
jgi:hypothetical protein